MPTMVESPINPAFAAAIIELDRQIEERQRMREDLVRLARNSAGSPEALAGIPPTSGSSSGIVGDPLAVVREQEFAGMSPAKAARAFLLKIGRHEKTPTIIAAIRKGGVEVGGKTPIPAMYTALARHSAFVSLGKNYWDLAERRPDLGRAKSEKAEKRKPKKKPTAAAKQASQSTKQPEQNPARRAPVTRESVKESDIRH